jgi:predicted DNA-binding protein YlxM (UPF0122 family)
MKTIREIANEIGVSKQAIYKKMKKEPLSTSLQGLSTKTDNGLQVCLQGETLIKAEFAEKSQSTVVSQPQSTVDNEVVDILRENLATLQAQLNEKDNQIAALTTQLDDERKHAREQSDKFAILADQAQKLQLIATNSSEPPADEREVDGEVELEDITVVRHDKPKKKRFLGIFG